MARKRQDEEKLSPFEQGRKAQQSGKSRAACPLQDYPSRVAPKEWIAGWDSAAGEARITHQEAQIRTPEVVVSMPGSMWPEGEPLPTVYKKPRPHPCPQCRLVYLPGRQQAVLVKTLRDGCAFLWCRGCGHRYKLAAV